METADMASITFEVECEVDGVVQGPEPDVGIMGPWIEDVDISSVMIQVYDAESANRLGRPIWRSVDLLDGLDTAARRQVVLNIHAAFRDQIEGVILADA
jgi:hypothetical protein